MMYLDGNALSDLDKIWLENDCGDFFLKIHQITDKSHMFTMIRITMPNLKSSQI